MRAHLLTISVALAGLLPTMAMAGQASSANGRAEGGFCTATSNMLFRACSAEVQDDYFVAAAACLNISDAAEREECVADARTTRREGNLACRKELDWREDGCDLLGEDRYDPDFGPDSFDRSFRNPIHPNRYFPLAIGNRWEYRGGDETVTVDVLNETKLIEGVRCIVVRDLVREAGQLIEATDDWFAQAKDGAVWYCGEEVKDYETFAGDRPARPELVSIDGSFKVGLTLALSPQSGTHSEHVIVSGDRPYRQDRGVAAEASIDRRELASLHGVAGDDPFRAVHALPGVGALDDFRSEFAVRGSPFRHVDVVIDGVATPWLRHTIYGRRTSGSVAMLTGQVLDEVTIRAGAYPHRHSERLGAQLELVVREGSRAGVQVRGAIGGTNATFVGEGPLGRSASGSWLVSVRQSYREWPTESDTSTRSAFGFSDTAAKLVYDVRPNQQVGLIILGGITAVDEEEDPASDEVGEGINRTSMVNLVWRSTFRSAIVLRQRAYLVSQRYLDSGQRRESGDRGANDEMAYRADITRPLRRGVFEAGAQAGRIASRHGPKSAASVQFAGAAALGSAYAHLAWAASPTVTVSPGLRIAASGLLAHPTIARWVLAEWAFRPRWRLTASAGVSYQAPDPQHVFGSAPATRLRPERARYVDVSIEQRFASSVRWRAIMFSRAERDVLREPDLHPRLVDGRVVDPSGAGAYSNALRGAAHGAELLVDRWTTRGLAGWVAYSYGRTRHTDTERHETFWADLDQRHALTLHGVYRFSARTSVGTTLRTGSNFPIPAHLAVRDRRLFVGSSRNEVRLPAYARLDVRGDRAFDYHGRRVTIFAEVANVLNRTNIGVGNGSMGPLTGEASGFTDTLLPRQGTAGLLVEF